LNAVNVAIARDHGQYISSLVSVSPVEYLECGVFAQGIFAAAFEILISYSQMAFWDRKSACIL
jgi:hypothetical protein